MKISTKFTAVIVLIPALLITGCASDQYSSNHYNGSQAMGVMQVRLGTVQGVRPVQIQSRDTGVGAMAGAGVGGTAGSVVGNNYRSGIVGAIGGAVLGGLAGNLAEKKLDTTNGVEITVQMDRTGELIAVTQAADVPFTVGERVKVMVSNRTGVTRVTPLN